jgi:hypothetical protein
MLGEYGSQGWVRCILATVDSAENSVSQPLAALQNYLYPLLNEIGALASYHYVQHRDRETCDHDHGHNAEECEDDEDLPSDGGPGPF